MENKLIYSHSYDVLFCCEVLFEKDLAICAARGKKRKKKRDRTCSFEASEKKTFLTAANFFFSASSLSHTRLKGFQTQSSKVPAEFFSTTFLFSLSCSCKKEKESDLQKKALNPAVIGSPTSVKMWSRKKNANPISLE